MDAAVPGKLTRLVRWLPLLVISVGAAVGGHYVGRSVERLGPIGSVSAPLHAILLEGGVAVGAGVFGILLSKRDSSETVGVVTGSVWLAIMVGTYLAFNTVAGSRDCPGSQDCDTLMVPVMLPLVIAAAVGATLGALGGYGAARLRRG